MNDPIITGPTQESEPCFWAVAGRIPHEEDTVEIIEGGTYDEAIETFDRRVWQASPRTVNLEAERERCECNHGATTFINLVLRSASPIEVI